MIIPKIEVYTSIIGDKCPMRDDIRVINETRDFGSSRMTAKIPKALPHYYLPGADYTIWIDGNVFLKKSPEEYVEMLDGCGVGVFPHWHRNCVYQEASECFQAKLDDRQKIIDHVRHITEIGWPYDAGLYCCFLIVRKNTPCINTLNEKWWVEICTGSSRDQLSFPYVFNGAIKIFPTIPLGQENDNEYYTRIV